MEEHQTSFHFIFLVDITLHQFCSLYYYTLYILYIYTYIFYAHKRHMQIIIYNMHYTSETTYLTYLSSIVHHMNCNNKHYTLDHCISHLKQNQNYFQHKLSSLNFVFDKCYKSSECSSSSYTFLQYRRLISHRKSNFIKWRKRDQQHQGLTIKLEKN